MKPQPCYRVFLTKEDVEKLSGYKSGKHSARKVLIARALLMMDEGEFTGRHWTVRDTSAALGVNVTTLQQWKKSFLTSGLESTLERKKRMTPPVKQKITTEVESQILALACTSPPEGYAHWTVRLLAKKIVELQCINSISKTSVAEILKRSRDKIASEERSQ